MLHRTIGLMTLPQTVRRSIGEFAHEHWGV
jgi:hypothetical protein